MQKNLDWKERPYFYDHESKKEIPVLYYFVEWIGHSIIGFGIVVVGFSLLGIL